LRRGVGIWKVAHAAAAVSALRLSEVLANDKAGVLLGVGMGIVSGLLIETLLAALRSRLTKNEPTRPGALTYLSMTHRLADRADFLGTAAVCALWFAFTPTPHLTGFKVAWLASALLMAHALARPISRYSRPM